MIAKVHIAKKVLNMVDDDYRAVLFDIAGVSSAADASDRDLAKILAHFESKGFRATAKAGAPRKAKPADNPTAKKARAMWLSLYALNAINDPSETALEAFAARQLGVEKMQWMNQAHGYKLIEALKAIATRSDWKQDDLPKQGSIMVLKRRLCDAILARLRKATIAPRAWMLDDAAHRLLGMEKTDGFPWTSYELDAIAQGLGKKLREWRGETR